MSFPWLLLKMVYNLWLCSEDTTESHFGPMHGAKHMMPGILLALSSPSSITHDFESIKAQLLFLKVRQRLRSNLHSRVPLHDQVEIPMQDKNHTLPCPASLTPSPFSPESTYLRNHLHTNSYLWACFWGTQSNT